MPKRALYDHYDGQNDKTGTPKDLYKDLHKEFNFDFDPCPLCYNPETDVSGLEQEWGKCNFVNPPYSDIGPWLKKGIECLKEGKKSVFLITARPNSRYWFETVWKHASEIRWLQGRVKFIKGSGGLPIGSVIVVLDPKTHKLHKLSKKVYKAHGTKHQFVSTLLQ
jgi:hypothetical protein